MNNSRLMIKVANNILDTYPDCQVQAVNLFAGSRDLILNLNSKDAWAYDSENDLVYCKITRDFYTRIAQPDEWMGSDFKGWFVCDDVYLTPFINSVDVFGDEQINTDAIPADFVENEHRKRTPSPLVRVVNEKYIPPEQRADRTNYITFRSTARAYLLDRDGVPASVPFGMCMLSVTDTWINIWRKLGIRYFRDDFAPDKKKRKNGR